MPISIEEMMQDLEMADAAGDTQLAQAIAARIKAAQAGGPPAPAPAGPGAALPAPPSPAGPAPGMGAATPAPAGLPGPPVAPNAGRPRMTPEELQEATAAAQREAQQKLLDSMSMFEKGAAGFGQSLSSTGRGVRQMFNYLTGDDEELARLEQEEADSRETDKALLGTGAGRTGQILGYATQSAIPGGAALRALRAKGMGTAAIAAAESALGGAQGAAQATTKDESRAKNAAVGATIGGMLPLGVAGARLVGGAGAGLAHAINPALGRAAGVMTTTAALTKRSADKVRRNAGAKIGELTDNLRVPLTGAMVRELRAAREAIKSSIPKDLARSIDTMLSFGPNTKMKGKELELLRQGVNAAAHSAKGSSSPGVAASAVQLNKIKRAIDAAQFGQMSKAQAAALRKAREQHSTGHADMNEYAASSLRALPKGAIQSFYED